MNVASFIGDQLERAVLAKPGILCQTQRHRLTRLPFRSSDHDRVACGVALTVSLYRSKGVSLGGRKTAAAGDQQMPIIKESGRGRSCSSLTERTRRAEAVGPEFQKIPNPAERAGRCNRGLKELCRTHRFASGGSTNNQDIVVVRKKDRQMTAASLRQLSFGCRECIVCRIVDFRRCKIVLTVAPSYKEHRPIQKCGCREQSPRGREVFMSGRDFSCAWIKEINR